ncbi:MAG TPA: hypothetical protein PLM38_02420 [Ottowia sp.]|jgi:hypothetical protein|nr:hypothetical protein [Ottowia sp.]HNK52548.1 hypothetical protein [Ottowia sp.]HNN33620.1 hypothetical protein [Ottowia sp.]
MKSTALIATIAILAATGSTTLLAADRDTARNVRATGYDHNMQVVANHAAEGTRAHGWRYFSDPQTRRAVVISPEGDYYLSRGKGLRWVAGTPSAN